MQPRPTALDVLDQLTTAFNAHDADAFASLFAPDAWFINVLGHRFSGRAEIAEAHRFVFSTVLASSRMRCTDIASRTVTDDVALIEAVWESIEDGPSETRHGIMILVLRKGPGGEWAIAYCTNGDY